MAEARIGVATPVIEKYDDDTGSSWSDIYKSYRIILIRNYFRLRNSIKNGLWPTSSTYLLVMGGFSIYLLEFQPKSLESLSSFLCDSALSIPMPIGTPQWLRHIVFSVGVSVTFFLTLMKLRQYMLRMLLSYRGWMNEIVKRQSITTTIWGLMVKFVSGYQPSLYSFQNSLPRMSVPPLQQTLDKLLESLEPLCTEEEHAMYKKEATEFRKTIGNRLQRILVLKSWISPNYVSDWWEKYAYLRSRIPIAINSNYYIIDYLSWKPTNRQTSRAANLLHSMLQLKRQIDREEFHPLVIRNTIPICMNQYERVFSTTRMPGVEYDSLVHYESSKSRHVVVWCGEFYFTMPVVDADNQILAPSTFVALLDEIKGEVVRLTDSDGKGNGGVPALTALPRSDWARMMQKHFSDGLNAENINIIETAVCMVVLYDDVPDNISHKAKRLLYGTGDSLWFDKCFTLCVFTDGQAGFNVEHTMADAPVIGHLIEYSLTMEVIERKYLDCGAVMPSIKSFKQKYFPKPKRIIWEFSPQLNLEIEKAQNFAIKNNEDLDLVFFNHNDFGKGFVKSIKISPDAFIQIALQLAYFKDSGSFCQTYEASATRLFLQGRTETIRSCTNECCEFVRAMVSGEHSKSELVELLHKASAKHKQLYVDAMCGLGIDRHIFALYIVSRGLGYKSKFLEDVISRPWTLSTSQQPQQQCQLDIPDLNLDSFRKMLGPGGGFGPVSDDGYGVSYMIPTEHQFFFHVTSKFSSKKTSSERFVKLIQQSLSDLRNIFVD